MLRPPTPSGDDWRLAKFPTRIATGRPAAPASTTKSGGCGLKAISWRRLRPQTVSNAADGMDELLFPSRIHFVPEQAYESVKSVVPDLGIESPHRLNQAVARDYAARAPHQQFEQGILCSRERDPAPPAHDFPAGRIQRKVGNLEKDRLR